MFEIEFSKDNSVAHEISAKLIRADDILQHNIFCFLCKKQVDVTVKIWCKIVRFLQCVRDFICDV